MIPGQGVDQGFWNILGVYIFLLFGITVAMVCFVVRYRRGKNSAASDIRDNYKLEIVWIVVPTLIALWVFFVGWFSYLS